MKKILTTLFCLGYAVTSFALGPSEIYFNGMKYYKSSEKPQNNVLITEYEPASGSSSSIILTHVLDKNDPTIIAAGLKKKKSIEVMDVENLNPENSDVLVTFVKFDQSNAKVENNLCRIFKNPGQNGSLVFQYVDKKNLNRGEGVSLPDFTLVAQNIKTLPLDTYLTTNSEPKSTYASSRRQNYSNGNRYNNNNSNSYSNKNANVPWYKRPGARAGSGAFQR
ncbi:MAG: hypothetical protein AB7V32_08700 [Candidatus Berkiella sp.]